MRNNLNFLKVLFVEVVVTAFVYWAARATVFAAGSPTSGNLSVLNSVTNGPYQYDIYDYTETLSNGSKTYRIVIPKGVATVRGLLVVPNYAGGDSRDYYKASSYEEFMHIHGFAFIGASGGASHQDNYPFFQRFLARFAQVSRHRELVHVPYAATGFSAGGGFVRDLLLMCPERVLAAVMEGTTMRFTGPGLPTATEVTPTLVINGEVENMSSLVLPALAQHRPAGAAWGYMEHQGRGHEMYGQEVLAMPYLDEAVRLRYPSTGDVREGPLQLKRLDPMSGWIADNRTFRTNLVNISPAAQFTGDIQQSSWLISKDIAYIYRAYASFHRPLSITSPTMNDSMYAPVQEIGSSVRIVVDTTKFPGWKTLVFYDHAKELGKITLGSTQFTAKNLAPGYHVFSVLGTDAGGDIRPSNPVMVVVRKPLTDVHDARQ